jgi:hypothetical protein
VLSRIASKRLTAFVVWVPQLAGTRAFATTSSRLIDDARTHHYWDQTDVTGMEFGRVLGAAGPVWDVYLLYAPGILWTAALPPRPTFWMQQLGLPNAPWLDAPVLAQRVRALLEE